MEREINQNNMKLTFDAKSENEALARLAVAAFITPIDPTLEELSDIKTAVSEAVTNSIIHGYNEGPGEIELKCILKQIKEKGTSKNYITIQVKDKGVGIEDIQRAMEPLYTSKPDMERSGMGFMFMELFMDKVKVDSKVGEGTSVVMEKLIKKVDRVV